MLYDDIETTDKLCSQALSPSVFFALQNRIMKLHRRHDLACLSDCDDILLFRQPNRQWNDVNCLINQLPYADIMQKMGQVPQLSLDPSVGQTYTNSVSCPYCMHLDTLAIPRSRAEVHNQTPTSHSG